MTVVVVIPLFNYILNQLGFEFLNENKFEEWMNEIEIEIEIVPTMTRIIWFTFILLFVSVYL